MEEHPNRRTSVLHQNIHPSAFVNFFRPSSKNQALSTREEIMKTTTDGTEIFPVEIWYYLFSFLENRDLNTLFNTCKTFRQMIENNLQLFSPLKQAKENVYYLSYHANQDQFYYKENRFLPQNLTASEILPADNNNCFIICFTLLRIGIFLALLIALGNLIQWCGVDDLPKAAQIILWTLVTTLACLGCCVPEAILITAKKTIHAYKKNQLAAAKFRLAQHGLLKHSEFINTTKKNISANASTQGAEADEETGLLTQTKPSLSYQ